MKQTYLIFMSQAEIYNCLVLTPSQFLTHEIPFLTSSRSKLPKYQSQSRRTLQKIAKLLQKLKNARYLIGQYRVFGFFFVILLFHQRKNKKVTLKKFE